MSVVIPPEICGIICQDPTVERYDLLTLCSVTRSFRAEAERILYASVSVRGVRQINAFCIALARRPHLAEHLKRLTLYMPPLTGLQVDDLSRVMHALHLSANLKELSVLQDIVSDDDTRLDGFYTDKPSEAVHRWILEGHTFRLEKFTNSYFHPPLLLDFLKEQSSIQTLALRSKGNAEICDAELPHLTNLDSSAAVLQEFSVPSWHRRNIQRLQIDCERSTDVEELATFVALTQFTDTLKSLSIRRTEGTNGLDIAVLTACVAAQLPDLRYLRIMDYTTRSEVYYVPFLPFPVRFTQIRTLVFRLPTGPREEGERDMETCSFIELRTAEGRRGAAERIMKTLPTLARFVLIGDPIHEFVRDLDSGTISDRNLEAIDDDEWLLVE